MEHVNRTIRCSEVDMHKGAKLRMVLGRLVCYRDVNASNICQALLNYEVSGAVSIGNIWLGANVLTSMNTQPSCLLGIGMIMNQDWEAYVSRLC